MGSTKEAHDFEFVGGYLCLDFVNTVDSWPIETDYLTDYDALLVWSRQAGLLPSAQARRLGAWAQGHPREAQSIFHYARQLREILYDLFDRQVDRGAPSAAHLSELNRKVPDMLSRLRLVPAGKRFDLKFPAQEGDPEAMLWPVLQSAVELLVSDDVTRIGRCAEGSCKYFFVDSTKNKSRRWCDMGVCGNRSKVRRFRARKATV